MKARALWWVAEGRAELREEELRAPGPGEVLVRALYSGISTGTERLVASGGVPEELHEAMRPPHTGGAFPFPIKYGYSLVGVVEQGPEALKGQLVHALHPHQSHAVLSAAEVTPIGEVPARRATLASNMETALNALWDGGVQLGERCLVVGFGIIGALTAHLLARLPSCQVAVVEPNEERRRVARQLGLPVLEGLEERGRYDVAFHCASSSEGLQSAIEAVGVEGRVVDLSWYGRRAVTLRLGGSFHADRKRLISSQVGRVAPPQRARFDLARRKQVVLELLGDERLDALVTDEQGVEMLPALFSKWTPRLFAVVRYAGSGPT